MTRTDVTIEHIKQTLAPEGHVGIEIEVEAHEPLPQTKKKPWKYKGEGSLRLYGMEYFTDGPILCDENKFPSIKYLTDLLGKRKLVENSPRTSLHVHVNVSQYTPVQVWNAAVAYWLFENLLVKFCGPKTREGNLFCLRLTDAEAILRFVSDDIKISGGFSNLHADVVRYAGQNLSAVRRFGSIEYRTMRGTNDPVLIDMWSSELHRMVDTAATKFTSPVEVMDKYFKTDREEFLSLFFSKSFVKILKENKGWVDLLDDNAGILCDMVYHTDWKKYTNNIIKAYKGVVHPRDRNNSSTLPGLNTHWQPNTNLLRHMDNDFDRAVQWVERQTGGDPRRLHYVDRWINIMRDLEELWNPTPPTITQPPIPAWIDDPEDEDDMLIDLSADEVERRRRDIQHRRTLEIEEENRRTNDRVRQEMNRIIREQTRQALERNERNANQEDQTMAVQEGQPERQGPQQDRAVVETTDFRGLTNTRWVP